MFKKKITIALLLSSLLFIGCGDDSSTPNDEDRPTTNEITLVSIEGRVADGYLSNAKVCVDLNLNEKCDSNEPSTISLTGGRYELKDVDLNLLKTYPIVVEVIAGVTIDEDDNLTVANNYTLSAPVEEIGFISPLSTMIKTYMDENTSMSLNDAMQQFLLDGGISPEFALGNYIEENTEEAIKAHNIARIIAKLKTQLKDKIINQNPTIQVDDIIGGFTRLLNTEIKNSLRIIATEQIANTSSLDSKVTNIVGLINVDQAESRLLKHQEKIILKLNADTAELQEKKELNIQQDVDYIQNGESLKVQYTILESANSTCTVNVDTTGASKEDYLANINVPLYIIEENGVALEHSINDSYTLINTSYNKTFSVISGTIAQTSNITISATCEEDTSYDSIGIGSLYLFDSEKAENVLLSYYTELFEYDRVGHIGFDTNYIINMNSTTVTKGDISLKTPVRGDFYNESIGDNGDILRDDINWSGTIIQVVNSSYDDISSNERTQHYKTIGIFDSRDRNNSFIKSIECTYTILGKLKCDIAFSHLEQIETLEYDVSIGDTREDSIAVQINLTQFYNLKDKNAPYFYEENVIRYFTNSATLRYTYVDPTTNLLETDQYYDEAEWFRYRDEQLQK